MKIGIDIDDVLTNTSDLLMEYLEKYEKSGDGIKYSVPVMRGEIPTENIRAFCNKYMNEVFKNVKLKDNSKKTINMLVNNGHEIFFITSRSNEKYPDSENTTLKFLKHNAIQYSKIIFNSHDKQNDCVNNKIDIMIDDSIKNCELVNKHGIKAIVYNSKINKNINTTIERVNDWLELKKALNKYAESKITKND